MASEDKTQVRLEVNGEQAKQELDSLRKKFKDLQQSMQEAVNKGDEALQHKLGKDLEETAQKMQKLTERGETVKRVMSNMSVASFRDLNVALKETERNLKNMERGTDAWDKQRARVVALREEINRTKAAMQSSAAVEGNSINLRGAGKSLLNGSLTGAISAVGPYGVAAASLTAAAGKAVTAFADLEKEMVTARQITGLSADEMQRLQDEFKKFSSATPRTELTKLAQEAGRLGKNSVDDILGFVRAADKIQTALPELGEGVTPELSKITTLFGLEQERGTEESLLAVGSTIKALADSCAASTPNVAQFVQRLAAVGSGLGLTVPQIASFGAVLEASGINAERGASSINKILTELFSKTDKLEKAGLDVEKLNAAMAAGGTNGRFMELLRQLSEVGSMDKLAPIFKDMGDTGAYAQASLSALSQRIGELQEKQELANRAMEEATAINDVYEQQNNTLAKRMEKTKQQFSEIGLELGESLTPAVLALCETLKSIMPVLNPIIKGLGEIIGLAGRAITEIAGLDKETQDTKALKKEIENTFNGEKTISDYDAERIKQARQQAMQGLFANYTTTSSEKTKGKFGKAEQTPEFENQYTTYNWEYKWESIGKSATKTLYIDKAGNFYTSEEEVKAAIERGRQTVQKAVQDLPPIISAEEETKPAPVQDDKAAQAAAKAAAQAAKESAQAEKDAAREQQEALREQVTATRQLHEENLIAIKEHYIQGFTSTEAYNEELELENLAHLQRMRDIYEQGTAEWQNADNKYRQAYADALIKKMGKNQSEEEETEAIDAQAEAVALTGWDKLKAWGDEAHEYINDFFENDMVQSAEKAMSTTMNLAQGMISAVQSLYEAQLEAQTNMVENYYDKQIAAADGNKVVETELEEQKQKKIAKLKSDAAKKNAKLQLANAIISGAASAIAAFKSGWEIGGLAGMILAPTFMAASLATTAIQIATIKQQQENASDAGGYAEGGYTGDGDVNDIAGVVHRGEYVVPARMVQSPQYRPAIELLERSRQRGYAVGGYVSEPVENTTTIIQEQQNARLEQTISQLTDRLQQPFVTVNTMTGTRGIKQAQDEYELLMQGATR